MIRTCPNCKVELGESEQWCPHCGERLFSREVLTPKRVISRPPLVTPLRPVTPPPRDYRGLMIRLALGAFALLAVLLILLSIVA